MEQQRALLCKAAVRRKDLEQQRVLFSKVVRRKDLKYTVQAWPASVFMCQDALLILGDEVAKVDSQARGASLSLILQVIRFKHGALASCRSGATRTFL
jgi:hypothetical protein